MRSVNQDLGALGKGYVVCSCEGAAEETVMNILLDNGCLIFDRESLVDKKLAEDVKRLTFSKSF